MNITLINPPLIDTRSNFAGLTTIPIGISYLSGYLKEKKINVNIIDGFGEAPNKITPFKKNYIIRGLTIKEIIEKINKNTDLIGISVIPSVFHNIAINLIKEIKEKFPKIPIVIGGNHATFLYKEFLNNNANFVILGEGEESLYELTKYLEKKLDIKNIDGIAYKKDNKIIVNKKTKFIEDLDKLPIPDREAFPLQNYWKLKAAHGPVNEKYISIMTSRGCPNECGFCSSPNFWKRKYRSRSPKNVVDEIEYYYKKLNVQEFQFEDDNFTADKNRAIKICKEIINSNIKISWNLPNGVRTETIDEDLLNWMKKAGCNHITVAPETGSENVLKLMKKRVNLNHLIEIIKLCNKIKIKTCAFIIIGFPGEKKKDLKLTKRYIKRLAKAGLDELSIGMVIPIPGSDIYDKFEFKEWEDLLITVPTWRKDYKFLHKKRIKLYLNFITIQLIYHPEKITEHVINLFSGKNTTKTDMALKKIIGK